MRGELKLLKNEHKDKIRELRKTQKRLSKQGIQKELSSNEKQENDNLE